MNPTPLSLSPAPVKESTIEALELAAIVVRVALDTKADEMVVLDLDGRTSYSDHFILCNGSNPRQVRAIANNVLSTLKKEHGILPVGVEGLDSGKWVLVDLGDVVLHVFEFTLRGYYDLDGLWIDAPRVPLSALGLDELGRPIAGADPEGPSEPEAHAPAP